MRFRVAKHLNLHVLLAGVILLNPVLSAQVATPEPSRKVKSRVAPAYPDLAKRMSVTGSVKIEVVIAPDGKVKSTRVIGGHPLLVSASVDALKEWKFVQASEESKEVVVFQFKGNSK